MQRIGVGVRLALEVLGPGDVLLFLESDVRVGLVRPSAATPAPATPAPKSAATAATSASASASASASISVLLHSF